MRRAGFQKQFSTRIMYFNFYRHIHALELQTDIKSSGICFRRASISHSGGYDHCDPRSVATVLTANVSWLVGVLGDLKRKARALGALTFSDKKKGAVLSCISTKSDCRWFD